MLLLAKVMVWACSCQALGLLSKELKIKDHTDVQKQQDNFIRSKAILQVIQGDTVVIDRGLHK